MSWISKAIGIAGKIGGIASKWAGAGGTIGKIAGGVAKAASAISTFVPKIAPIIGTAATIGSALYKSGIADKLTGGAATRIVKGITNAFAPFKGSTISNAPAIAQATTSSNTTQFMERIKR